MKGGGILMRANLSPGAAVAPPSFSALRNARRGHVVSGGNVSVTPLSARCILACHES